MIKYFWFHHICLHRMLISAFSFLWHRPVTWLSRPIRYNRIIILRYNNKCCCISVSSWAASFLAFSFVYWIWAVYIPPLPCTIIRTMEHIIARPITLAHVQSSDHLVFCAFLSYNLSTVAFIVQQSHTNARYIAKFNAFTSHNARLDRAKFVRILFSYAIISATVDDSYLIFSVARIFGRFCSCANCERGFMWKDDI